MTPPRGERAGRGLPEDQAVRVAAAKDLRHSWLLEAGAGTGKTTVLLDRVEEILKTETPLDKVAVITFTEKAAGELKLKLRQRVEGMLATAGEGRWAGYLRGVLESLDRAAVGTIHAFAASLLKERPVEAGVDPRFAVADELTASMLMEETWQRWIERETSGGAPALSSVLRQGVTLAHLRRLAFAMVDNRDAMPVAAPPAPAGAPEAARDRVLALMGDLRGLAGSCRVETDEGLRRIRLLEAHGESMAGAEGDRLLRLMADLPLKTTAGSQANWDPPGDLRLAKGIFQEIATLREAVLGPARRGLAGGAAAWLRTGFLQEYRAAKEARRLLDFADLLIICRNMLRESRAARSALQQRFDCLLVDEFQDTDPLQAEIVFLLAAAGPDETDWLRARPRPGKLFVVGDPKQSIYRFRRADVEVYGETKALIASSGGVTGRSLTQNFRTVPSVVGWVNDLFGRLMPPGGDPRLQPDYVPIAAYRAEPDGEAPRVLLVTPARPEDLSGARADEVRAAEARHVAALVAAMVAQAWPVADPQTGGARPARHGDVALLFRTGTAVEVYEEVLRARSIPYRLTGGRRYYMRAEMRALQAVLQAVESPHDPLAVVSALRCPVFGHSDEELLTHAASRSGWNYAREGAGRGTPFERAFDLLARLHALRESRPAAATLEDLFESTGALSLYWLKPDGEQRAANLLKAIDLARAHEQAGGATFSSFVRWHGRMASEEREEAEAPLTEEAEADAQGPDGDAVRLLTVHKAKGLEYPIVVLCDPAGSPRSESPLVVVERPLGAPARLQFRIGRSEDGFESPGYRAAAEREKARLAAESLRLLYVACTRARDYLVVPAFAGERAGGIYKELARAGLLPQAGRMDPAGARVVSGASLDTSLPEVEPLRIAGPPPSPPDPALLIEKEAWRRALKSALAAPTMGRRLVTASAMESLPRDRGAPGHASGGPAAAAERDRRGARAVGVAVHAVLERIDLATGRDIGVLCEEEAAACGLPELAPEVRALVEKALQGHIVREALAAPRHFREIPVAVAGDTYIAEGRIDLVFESGGALTIVDFKTDHVATEAEVAARVEAYRPQALVYGRALAQVSRVPVSRVVFFFIRAGVEKVLKVDDAFQAQARRLLETGTLQPPS